MPCRLIVVLLKLSNHMTEHTIVRYVSQGKLPIWERLCVFPMATPLRGAHLVLPSHDRIDHGAEQ